MTSNKTIEFSRGKLAVSFREGTLATFEWLLREREKLWSNMLANQSANPFVLHRNLHIDSHWANVTFTKIAKLNYKYFGIHVQPAYQSSWNLRMTWEISHCTNKKQSYTNFTRSSTPHSEALIRSSSGADQTIRVATCSFTFTWSSKANIAKVFSHERLRVLKGIMFLVTWCSLLHVGQLASIFTREQRSNLLWHSIILVG